jgi:hypothetical protein
VLKLTGFSFDQTMGDIFDSILKTPEEPVTSLEVEVTPPGDEQAPATGAEDDDAAEVYGHISLVAAELKRLMDDKPPLSKEMTDSLQNCSNHLQEAAFACRKHVKREPETSEEVL